MTREEINALDMDQLEQRAKDIAAEVETAEGDALDAFNDELTAIEERKATIETEAEEKRAAIDAVIEGHGEVIEERKEVKHMNSKEVRALPEYVNAYAEYIKGNNDGEECRALLTTNAVIGSDETGTIPVPTYIEDRIAAAWENDEIMQRVRRTFIRGNVKVGAEISATGAVFHDEGADAPAEEVLTLAVVDIIAKSVKKWITVSDEALALTGEAFLAYLYDEIEYQIVKAEAAEVVNTIINAPTTGTDAPIVGTFDGSATTYISEIVYTLEGMVIGDNKVVIANPGTIAAAKVDQLNAGFAFDPFDGLTVIETSALPSIADASTGDAFLIVGDLQAIQANFPEGGEVTFKFDDLSLAEHDLVKIVGRQMCGIGLVRTKAFAVATNGTK